MRFTRPAFYNQWTGLLDNGSNWQELTIIRLEFEKDNLMSLFTVMVTLLGFSFNWTLIWNEEKYADTLDVMDEIMGIRRYEVTTKEIDTNG